MATIPQNPSHTPEHYRIADLTIEALAHDEAELRERIADLLCERDIYRDMAIVSMHTNAALTVQHKWDQQKYYRSLDDNRQLRTERSR